MSWAHFTLGIYKAQTEVATGGVLWKNVYLNFRNNPLGNTFIRVSFVNKLLIIKNIFEWLLLHELHTFPFYPFEGWPIFYMEVGRVGSDISSLWNRISHWNISVKYHMTKDLWHHRFCHNTMCSLLTQTHKYKK